MLPEQFSEGGDMKRPLRLARLFRPLSSVELSGIDVAP
jgi:hypothetical protein